MAPVQVQNNPQDETTTEEMPEDHWTSQGSLKKISN
jgi:hypothetical protein